MGNVVFGLFAAVILVGGIAFWSSQTVAPAPPRKREVAAAGARGLAVELAGGGVQHVAGESFYQEALERAGGGRDEDGVLCPQHRAVLRRDPANEFDKNAVEVLINGERVGHIPRGETHRYQRFLKSVEKQGGYVWCHASLTGGWDRSDNHDGPIGDWYGYIGVELDISQPVRAER